MPPLWFYKHHHDNPIRSKLFVACHCAHHLRMELSNGGYLQNLVRNWSCTIVTDRNSFNVSTQNAFSLPFAAILVNCAPSGEMQNYCTPHIIKESLENFLIHRCKYILLSQVYCVWQVVKTRTFISNNTEFLYWIFCHLRKGSGTSFKIFCMSCTSETGKIPQQTFLCNKQLRQNHRPIQPSGYTHLTLKRRLSFTQYESQNKINQSRQFLAAQ